MHVTEPQLSHVLPNSRPVAGIFSPALNRAMARYKIDSPVRVAAFLAQPVHSGVGGRMRAAAGEDRQHCLQQAHGKHSPRRRLAVPWAWPDPAHRPGAARRH